MIFTNAIIIALIGVTTTTTTLAEEVNKCCDKNEIFQTVNGSLTCVEDVTKRLQIFSEKNGFWYGNTSGECVEVNDGFFYIFNISESGIFKVKPVSNQFYPKCCPLGFNYNFEEHSCEEQGKKIEKTYPFSQDTFFKIGLPHCNIIQDYNLEGTTDFDYHLKDNTKIKRNNLNYIGSYCVDSNNEGSLTLRECKDSIRTCEDNKCIKKCCPDGKSFVNGPICEDTHKHGIDLSWLEDAVENPTDPYVVLYNRSCPTMYIMAKEKYNYSINSKGVFTYWAKGRKFQDEISNMESYCIEHTKTSNYDEYLFFMCFGTASVEEKYLYTFYPLIVSCIFLLLTIIAYFVLGETKKMFGKILVNYCLAMLLQFAVLANSYTGTIGEAPTAQICQTRAFAIIFFATASFTWSNILCWDIWCTFGSTKLMGMKQWTVDLKQIIIYSLYGWGVPLILTLIIYGFFKFNSFLPTAIQPLLAKERCFFDSEPNNFGKMVFFDFPLLIMQIFNTVLFIKTVLYCIRVKNEIHKINDTTKNIRTKKFQKDKDRLFLILKLLTIMGISFLFEVVSGFFEMGEMGDVLKYTEIAWDFINALQGFFIFVVFVCKRKIWNGFVNKVKNPLLSRVSTSSINTQSINMVNGMALNPLVSNKNER